ncbi:zinc finger protein ZAT7-like [Aegilops tauschii subsp. strangulata]|uniref:zinc finger protein ZAT7-like n=1 Tax=Aegilops tauschii subsp. strangulata TaxID=200361 RepID=UPI00098A1AA4|nr:zinc finger protein ZAT12-like [Aegilops tauschii subsp. strangulata]
MSERHKLLGEREDDAVGAPTRRWESPRRGASGEMAPAHRPRGRVFECRTCGRRFPTYQALGGHRASHGRHLPSASRLRDGDALGLRLLEPRGEEARPRTHGCPVCGVEFAVGQALGGHMKRHRAAMADADANARGTMAATSVKDDGAGAECTPEICLDLNLAQAEKCAKCRNATHKSNFDVSTKSEFYL